MRDTDWRPSPCPTCGRMRHAAEHPVCDNCGPEATLAPFGRHQRQDEVEKATKELSDEDLLLELRRRGRFGRIEVSEAVPSHYVKQGMPVEYQVEATFKRIAHDLFRLHAKGQRMPGFKVETGNFLTFLQGGDGRGGDRRVRMVFNYIKEKD